MQLNEIPASAATPRPAAPSASSAPLHYIGIITRPHGLLGEVKVKVPPEYLHALEGIQRVYLCLPTVVDPVSYKIRGHRLHQEAVLLKFVRVVTRNDSEALRGAEVLIDFADLPALPPGEYYSYQLLGLAVVAEAGTALGRIDEVLATGSNDVYVVRKPDGGELLLPAITSVIRNIDLEAKTMTVVIPPGLEDESSSEAE